MIQELIKHLNESDFHPPIEKISLDGKVIRFDRNGKLNAWMIGFQNSKVNGSPYVVALYGDFKFSDKEYETYTSTSLNGHDKKIMEKQIKSAQIKVEAEKQQQQIQAAIEAEKFWNSCTENPGCDYLKIKQIKNLYGARTQMNSSGRYLVVPYRDIDGKLWGYQTIQRDGSKRFGVGQKKSGNFHIIPHVEALQDQSTIYIAEGFATAATIHEATGLAVVVAFDSGNLIKVAKALASKYNDKSFIICGDDDRFTTKPDGTPYNAGKECAEKAASICLGKTIFPVFKNPTLKLSDFNDLGISEGHETVKNQIMGIKPELTTVSCLGYSDGTYYFISSDNPNVTAVPKGSFTKNILTDLMPASYWESRFPHPKTMGIHVDAAIDSLMSGCRKVGKFIPKNVRGAGVWQDQKRTVVNLGDKLWVDGELKQYREFKSKYIYQSAVQISSPRDDFATEKDMNDLDNLIHKLSWKNPSHPKLLLGWLMVSSVCGSLGWRPHIWICGPSGSGKTTVMQEIIGKIFGSNSTKIMGRSSEAGIRQSVASDALPLLFDENETTDKKSENRVSSVIELFRQASSETDSHVVKGTVSGKSIAFNVRFCAAISSINVGLSLEQDVNRFSVLEMYSNKENGFTDPGGTRDQLEKLLTKEFVEKMYSRSIHKLSVIQDNLKVFYKIYQKRNSARFADQYGTLLAGYMAALQDEPISESMALDMVNSIDLKEHEDAASVKDEDECLEYLLSWKLIESGHSYSVGEMVSKIMNPSLFDPSEDVLIKSKTYNEILMRHGIKVHQNKLFVQAVHPELSKIFYNSKWPKGWAATLMRLHGSKAFSGWIITAVKGVLIDLSQKLTFPNS